MTALRCGCNSYMIRHAHFEGSFMCLEPVVGVPGSEGSYVVAGGRECVVPSDWWFAYASLEAAERAFEGFEAELLQVVL